MGYLCIMNRTMPNEAPLKLPLSAVLLDLLGAVLCGFGVYGLFVTDGPITFTPAAAIALVVIGVALMAYSLVAIMRSAREAARRARQV
jgi:hypothetical protein